MFKQAEGVKKKMAETMAEAFMLLRYLEHHPGDEQRQTELRQLKMQLQETGKLIDQIECGKKVVAACFFAASIAMDAKEGLANLAFQQTMSNAVGNMTGTGMSPTDPLSIISFCMQNIVMTPLNTATLAMNEGMLRGRLGMWYLKLKVRKDEVVVWSKTQPIAH